jgi:hypothetical protein
VRQTTSILSGALLASLATSSGLWAQGYGTSVAVGEDEVVVAEPLVETGPGAVFVYSRSGGEWVEGQRVEASDASQGDHFGRALALDGTTLIVGATVRENSRGAAYAFERGADGVWTESQLLLASDGADGDAFGRVVAIEDDLALVSTWGHAEGRGAVYVFRRDATGTWTEAAKLMGSDSRPNDWFGMSLALDGETILVGAPQKSGNRGAVYVFRRDAESDSWVEEAMLSEELPANASFGMAVALSGGHALVGAPGLYNGSGLVFDYRLDGEAGWVPTGALSAFDAALPGALFGSAIVDMGPEVWISAPGAGRGAGAAYVYRPWPWAHGLPWPARWETTTAPARPSSSSEASGIGLRCRESGAKPRRWILSSAARSSVRTAKRPCSIARRWTYSRSCPFGRSAAREAWSSTTCGGGSIQRPVASTRSSAGWTGPPSST